jgi:S1-C subfamily serine protease
VRWVKDRLIKDGKVRRGLLGIYRAGFDLKELADWRFLEGPPLAGVTTTKEVAERLGLNAPGGAIVAAVMEHMPASQAGLRRLDVITELDGRQIRSAHDLTLRVMELEPGTTVKLKFVRDRKVQEAKATLIERSPAVPRAPRRSP